MNNIIGKITVEDLLQINEAAKALKQKSFTIFNCNILVGLDNIDVCLKYTTIPIVLNEKSQALEAMQFNTRELSAFMKSITIETELDILIDNTNYSIYISNNNSNIILNKVNINLLEKFTIINNEINTKGIICNSELINDKISKLFEMHKADGCLYYIHHNKYYITMFPGMLPLNKSDKVFLEIIGHDQYKYFIAHFEIKKKKYTINIFIRYLKL
jgi:hypothetical protein